MKTFNLLVKFAFFSVTGLLLLSGIYGQSSVVPRQEKLLNGLKIYLFSDKSAPKVSLRLRIHSGSAFDPLGKEGTMALLARSFFPNETSRDFFRQDLGGDLEIVSNYDFIEIKASAEPENLPSLIENVSSSVINPTIDRETTEKLKKLQAAELNSLAAKSEYIGSQAVAARLFGTFPYGRPQLGSADSLGKIDFADLLTAKERFLTADNASLSITGNFDAAYTFRLVRRFFGSWLKSDKLVPSTFRQPDPPPVETQIINSSEGSYYWVAIRGLALGDADFPASLLAARIFQKRLAENAEVASDRTFLSYEGHILPGAIILAWPANNEMEPQKLSTLLSLPVGKAEFDEAKSFVMNQLSSKTIIDNWLDADTYKTASPLDLKARADKVTLEAVQKIAAQLASRPRAVVMLQAAPGS
ncbi:MAG TPA: pitrilysin family protein [Pyrinomonadaceae bacterium]|nr:pitrilysin family protein [Pyrinomonadaceae bacterium]